MTFEPLTPERRRAMTRQHLLDAAAIVFARAGFHAATLDEIAATAGFEQQHAVRGATARYPARQMAEISLAVFEGLSIHRLLDPDSVTDETLDTTLSAFFDLMGVPADSDEIPDAPA